MLSSPAPFAVVQLTFIAELAKCSNIYRVCAICFAKLTEKSDEQFRAFIAISFEQSLSFYLDISECNGHETCYSPIPSRNKRTAGNKKATHANQSNNERTSIEIERTRRLSDEQIVLPKKFTNFASFIRLTSARMQPMRSDSQGKYWWKQRFLSPFDDICE